jgi:hypothetical protein
MSTTIKQGPGKKSTLDEAADKVAAEFPDISANTNERLLFKEDFKLLVRTYVRAVWYVYSVR